MADAFNPLLLFNPVGVRLVTAAMRAANPLRTPPPEPEPEPEEEPDLTQEEQRLANISEALATGDFGCRRASVRKLVEAIVGGPLPTYITPDTPAAKPSLPELTYMVGAVVTRRGRSYLVHRIDEDNDAFFYNADGTEGGITDHAGSPSSETWLSTGDADVRPATEEEVERFLIEAELIPAPAVRLEAATPPPGASIREGE